MVCGWWLDEGHYTRVRWQLVSSADTLCPTSLAAVTGHHFTLAVPRSRSISQGNGAVGTLASQSSCAIRGGFIPVNRIVLGMDTENNHEEHRSEEHTSELQS